MIGSLIGAIKMPKLFAIIWGGMFGGMPWAFMVLPALTQNVMYIITYIIGIISIAVLILFAKIMPKRTPFGNEMLGKLRGFERFLVTAEKPQLEALVNENPEYFYNILPCCTGGGRNYFKKYDGFALSVIYYVGGSNILFVSKEKEAAKGYCSLNSGAIIEPHTLEFNNETWYYAVVEYGWADGTGFNGIYLGKNIGNINASGWEAAKQASLYALNEFFNG